MCDEQPLPQILENQTKACTYEDWLSASTHLDCRLSLDRWKAIKSSELYDHELIANKLSKLKSAMSQGNVQELLYLVRTSFQRNIGRIGNPALYQRSHCGTKQLIESYISECQRAVDYLVCHSGSTLSPDDPTDSKLLNDNSLLSAMIQTRKAYGRTALVLSGGATLGLMHSGVLFELHSQQLLPKIVSGSSAGSIVASIFCIHRDDEIDRLWEILESPLEIFEATGNELSAFARFKRFMTSGTFIDSAPLREMVRGMLGDITFQEAHNRTGKILNVTVSSSGLYEVPRLLNYLTAPDVIIWSAVCASCSLPLVFAGNQLYAKNPLTGEISSWSEAVFIDGSVDNDLPLTRLAEMFNVNHFIACQVNPHIAPFLSLGEMIDNATLCAASTISTKAAKMTDAQLEKDGSTSSRLWHLGKSLLLNEVTHSVDLLSQAGIMRQLTNKMTMLLSQEYIGDINIVPDLRFSDVPQLLRNPTKEIAQEAMERGRRATWPKLAIIRNQLAVELALDNAIYTLRARAIGTNGSLPLLTHHTSSEALFRNASVSAGHIDSPLTLSYATPKTLAGSRRAWSSSLDLNSLMPHQALPHVVPLSNRYSPEKSTPLSSRQRRRRSINRPVTPPPRLVLKRTLSHRDKINYL